MRFSVKKELWRHPCFQEKCGSGFGRIHLPVAPRCNIQCAYCDRKYDCVNESRPGVTSDILTPEQAVRRVEQALAEEPRIRVAGIAGPGDPLFNPETFETMRLLHAEFPDLILCVSTNGALLEEKLPELLESGLDTLTVTLNAVSLRTAVQIYTGSEEQTASLLEKQKRGIALCKDTGLLVKVNTVLIPGVNDGEIEAIARLAAEAGAYVMNVIPLIPCGAMTGYRAPSREELLAAREKAGRWLGQFTHCRQCRADACGFV